MRPQISLLSINCTAENESMDAEVWTEGALAVLQLKGHLSLSCLHVDFFCYQQRLLQASALPLEKKIGSLFAQCTNASGIAKSIDAFTVFGRLQVY